METALPEKLPVSFNRLNLTQFLGALNDNLLKLIIVFFLIGLHGTGSAGAVTAAVGGTFVLPFLLFSAPAGCLADRLRKSRLILAVKTMEVAVTAAAVAGFLLRSEAWLYAVVFLMGTHSALFAPAKYGIIPDVVPRDRLSRANGLMESSTFVAIIVGSFLAPLMPRAADRPWLPPVVCVMIALAGLTAAAGIGTSTAAAPDRKVSLFPAEILRTVQNDIRGDRHLFLAVMGLAWFMFVGAFAQLNLIPYGIERLGLSETGSGYLFLAAALGIGGGSLLAAKLSGRDVEFGIVPLGAIGLTLSPILLHIAGRSIATSVAIILLFGLSAGLFSLPLQTFIQLRADPTRRGEVLAASSFINWIGVLLASCVTWLFSGPFGFSAGQGLSLIGLATAFLTLISISVLPDFLLRFIALVTVRIFYRIRVIGRDNIPIDGPALLVPNHVTWADALLLTATTQRRIRFVMERRIYDTPVLHPLFRLMGVIPVSSTDGRKEMVEFIRKGRKALDEGYLLCIFAEGEITRNGMLREFHGGFERIVKESGHPVIPVYIGGAWGSILSYAHGRLLSRWPAIAPYPVTLLFGEPMSASSTAAEVRQKVAELSCAYFQSRKSRRRPLGESFIRTARRHWRAPAIADTSGISLSYGRTLAGALALARRLEITAGKDDHVGILLPPSVGGTLTNLALSFLGRIPVNLNYTAGDAAFRSALGRCGITTVVTSRLFLEKLPALPLPERVVFLEDILAAISGAERIVAYLRARLVPARLLCRSAGFTADRPATVIFSSGSTGEPKGVVLSHHNVLSNIEALRAVFRVDPGDNVCAALPFFHSLGFTGTLWFPLVSGFSAVYHTNPMEGETIARMARAHRSTILLATPTFLLAYLRRAKPEDFATLRLVVTGAEKLNPRVAEAFAGKFGITPLEGYGATELSPVIALNIPDVEIDGVRQQGAKEGSVGQPVPGVAVRVVDPETMQEIPAGMPGLILVKGPNVMTGYLGRPDLTAASVRDGWYVTGDIGVVDSDGFLRITDRLSRFSKIGGEMVPHGVVEDEIHTRLGKSQVVAVTAVPDERKGERLAVVYLQHEADPESLQRAIGESGLPNLWRPGRESLVAADALPMLGSGKLDLKRVKELALAALGAGG